MLALLVCGVPASTLQATVDGPQVETGSTLCVIAGTGLPVPVRFEKSIMLTQAIKQAGIAREDIKNRVFIFRRLQTNLLKPTKLDLKGIEKGAPDFELDQHDIVYVKAKKKQAPAELPAIGRSCEICGCTSRSLMHGGFVLLPKEWSDSSGPADPNNQKP